MYKLFKKNRGFTLLELTIVVSIVTVILAVSTGIYFSLRQGNVLDVEAQRIASALRLAHNRTLASKGLDSHGVHFDAAGNNFILFQGGTFDPLDPDNEQNELGDTAEFLNIQLEGAGVDVVYDRLAGTTSSFGFLEISNINDPADKRTICI
ncbi:MAG: prepilin-type N-terminal cleavage/methylation domain-containing protein, partial [Candidatus Spechtbacteria bacterium]|nr:prepilin-type N-terminal cleavage/methylation domain-containing protein [Candidatus Spechtbacteria bacterium]